MANDQVPEHQVVNVEPLSPPATGKFLLIFLVLVALAVGEFYTLHKIDSMRVALEAQQTETDQQLRAEFRDQLTSRLRAIERANAQQMDALKDELDAAAKHMGTTGGELKHARAMVAQLQNEVLSTLGKSPLAQTGGSFFIFWGLVREVCRKVPPVRSTVRVFSRLRDRIYRSRLAGSFRSTWVKPSHPRRIPTTSRPASLAL